MAMAGLAIGSKWSPWVAAAGGAIGAVGGYLLGDYAPILLYDLSIKGREWNNRLTTIQANQAQGKEQDELKPLPASFLRAVDPTGDHQRNYDGFDSSRDLFAAYSREGERGEPYQLQFEFAHLRAGAQRKHLNPELFLVGDDGRERPLDLSLHSTRFDPKFSHLRIDLDKERLRQLGWNDSEPLAFKVSTEVDEMEFRTDASVERAALKDSVYRWEGKTVYYAITDRFHNGDPSNDVNTDPADLNRFHGGDWQGVIDKLDYLDDLGVDVIWLSCPYENDRDFFGSDGYHGYWPHNFAKAEPSFGSKEKLKELTDKAHERGMKVILDAVVNHTGYNNPKVRDPEYRDWFHRNGNISWVGQWAMENQALSGLPDLDHSNPEVREFLLEHHRNWLKDTGVDGFRMDAVRHVPEEFLREFNEEMRATKDNFFSVGEAFWLDPNFVAGYQNRTQESMFDFTLAYAVRRVFSGDPNRTLADRLALAKEVRPHHKTEAIRLTKSNGNESFKLISEALSNDDLYDNPRKLGIFVDNHDMMRFMDDCGGDTKRLENALAFIYACRGTPSLYYGTEAAMDGHGPANRSPMQFGKNPEMHAHVKSLTSMRDASLALSYGTQKELYCDDTAYALTRIRNDEQVVCVFNNSEQTRTLEIPLDEDLPSATLTSLRDGTKTTARDGSLTVELPPKSFQFFQSIRSN